MLDTEPTGAGGDDTRDASSKDPETRPARTRRRKAPPEATGALEAGAAGPEAGAATAGAAPAGADAGTGAPEGAPPRRRVRKAAPAAAPLTPDAAAPAQLAESATPSGTAQPASTAVAAGAAESAAPAKRTRSRRAAPTVDPAVRAAEIPADVAAGAGAADGDAPAPARRRRSRAASTDDSGLPADGAAGPEKAARTSRSRRAAAPETWAGAAVEAAPAGPAGLTAGAAAWTDPGLPAESVEAAQRPARRSRRRATAAEASPGTARPDAEPPTTAGPTTSGPGGTGPGTSASAAAAPGTAPDGTDGAPASPFAGGPLQPERSPRTRRRATAPETSPPPAAVMFVAPVAVPFEAPVPVATGTDPEPAAPARRRRTRAAAAEPTEAPTAATEAAEEQPARRRRSRDKASEPTEPVEPVVEAPAETEPAGSEDGDETDEAGDRRRRRRGRRGRGRGRTNGDAEATDEDAEDATDEAEDQEDEQEESEDDSDRPSSRRRRRRRRRGGGGDSEDTHEDDPPDTVVHVRETRRERDRAEKSGDDEVRGVRGSTRLEAKRQRRREGRDTGRRRPPILTESEFLARREAVDRVMVVRQRGDRTQIAVLEDDILVEHYVTKASSSSYAGNVYLGRVQNVLPSMEAAFVDIGKGRNAVLYAGEVNWDVAGLEGRARSIEHALKSGDNIVVQVTKDPIGHKGARLTSQVSLPGRYLVYVPNGSMTGISRKLPDTERSRLKDILRRIVPEDAGVIIRTAAEGASEEELTRDVERLKAQWETIQQKAAGTKSAPTLLYAEPDLELRVVRDVFNEDFTKLVVSGDDAWEMISQYVDHVAPDLLPRLSRYAGNGDAFHDLRIDEQLLKALDRKVWLPSGGSLVIDRTEAMTVVDVNTGKFVGQGGNLEQTVTRNNLEAAEEIVRQLRLRDVGGIIVIDFIDMVLESNRDLVLRRLTECLGRDRTKHQVAEVTSLGLVQMTRKRVGQGLLEAFSEPCPTCGGRGLLVHTEPVDDSRKRGSDPAPVASGSGAGRGRRGRRGAAAEAGPPTPALLAGSTPPVREDDQDIDGAGAGAAAGADPAVATAASVGSGEADPAVATAASVGSGEADPAVAAATSPYGEADGAAVGALVDAGGILPASAQAAAGSPSEAAPLSGSPSDAGTPIDRAARTGTSGNVGAPAEAGTPAGDGPLPEAGPPAGTTAGTAPEAAGSAEAGTPVEVGSEATVPSDGGTPSGVAAQAQGAPVESGTPTGAAPATPAEIDVASEDHRPADEALDTVEAVEPEADVTVTGAEPRTAVAGSNGAVALHPGADPADPAGPAGLTGPVGPGAEPAADVPVAGSNGVPDIAGNGQPPRRRRRAASRPAGPPQPVSSD